MAAHHSPPSSTASSTDFENTGPLTLAQLINEIELITGSPIEIVSLNFLKNEFKMS